MGLGSIGQRKRPLHTTQAPLTSGGSSPVRSLYRGRRVGHRPVIIANSLNSNAVVVSTRYSKMQCLYQPPCAQASCTPHGDLQGATPGLEHDAPAFTLAPLPLEVSSMKKTRLPLTCPLVHRSFHASDPGGLPRTSVQFLDSFHASLTAFDCTCHVEYTAGASGLGCLWFRNGECAGCR
jgi:hypothetical protein